MLRLLRALLVLALLAMGGVSLANDQARANASQRHREALAAARAAQTAGPANVRLADQASLRLPAGHLFFPVPQATELMLAMGNTPNERLLGLVFPERDEGWFVVLQLIREGHVRDDDARGWNADEMLASLRADTEVGNAARGQRGIRPVEVIGWAEPPRYDVARRQLVWCAITRDVGQAASDVSGVNYNTYLLGRDGYISLNLVSTVKALPADRKHALALLEGLQFNDGRRYADFNPASDPLAPYGLSRLITGLTMKPNWLGLGLLALASLAGVALISWLVLRVFAWLRRDAPQASRASAVSQAQAPRTKKAAKGMQADTQPRLAPDLPTSDQPLRAAKGRPRRR